MTINVLQRVWVYQGMCHGDLFARTLVSILEPQDAAAVHSCKVRAFSPSNKDFGLIATGGYSRWGSDAVTLVTVHGNCV